MLVRIIKTYRDVVAICDSDLIGKRFESGVSQIDVKESFYKGREVSESEAIKIMQDFSMEDATFNIVGEESVKAALKAGVITENQVGKVQRVPFALVLM